MKWWRIKLNVDTSEINIDVFDGKIVLTPHRRKKYSSSQSSDVHMVLSKLAEQGA